LNYHGTHIKALIALYPELNLKKENFDYFRFCGSNRKREFFDSIAISKGLDPLNPETWYPILSREIAEAGGAAYLKRLGGYIKTVQQVYPEIHFQRKKFKKAGKRK